MLARRGTSRFDHAFTSLTLGLLTSLLAIVPGCSLETGGSAQPATDVGNDPPDNTNPDDGNTGMDDPGNDDGDAGGPVVTKDGAVVVPPTTTGSCTAGHYKGTYECTYKQQGPFGLSTSTVSGPVEFDLAQKSNDDNFDVADGTFAASAALQTVSGTMDGTLTCGRPFEGKLIKGMAGGLFPIGGSSFEATLNATYDTKLMSFVQGTWSIPSDSSGPGCDGIWNAKLITATSTTKP